MKKSKLVAYLFALVVGISFQSVAQKKEIRKVSDFSQVSVGGGIFDVTLTQCDKEEVVLESKEDDLKKILTEVTDNRLKVYIDKKYSKRSNNIRAKIHVYCKDLEVVESSGITKIYSQNKIETNKMDISCSGSGNITLDINTKKLSVSLSGSGKAELTGNADENNIKISGSANIQALKLTTKETNISISGSGNASVNVSEAIEAKVSGSGNIRYTGTPDREKVKVSGSGNVSSID